MLKKFLSAVKFLFAKTSAAIICLLKNENPALIISIIFLFALRLLLGRMTGCYFIPFAYHDDALMINYADFESHFLTQELPQKVLLVKDMGFPLILSFLKWSGIVYTDLISFLQFVAALLTLALIRILTGKKIFLTELAIFAFILFTPIAFDLTTGTRLYRNAVLVPLYFIVLIMMTIIFVRHFLKDKIAPRRLFYFNLIFGLIFTLTFYVKEDGIWLLLCLISVSLICLIKIILSGEKILPRIAILLLPFFIFAAATTAYK